MSVNVVTGEIVGDLTADEARQIVARVRAGVDTIRTDIVRLWQGRAWVALGVESWESLCDNEFGVRMALPKDEHIALVTDLREQGMSTRAIGHATGVSHETIRQELSTVKDLTVETVISLDGRPRPARSRSDGIDYKTKGAPEKRVEIIRTMADEGYLAAQIAEHMDVGEPYIRRLAGEHDIELRADRQTSGTRKRIDHDRVLGEAVYALDGLRSGLKSLDLNGLTEAGWQRCHDEEWVTSLVESRAALNRLINQLKEITQ